LAIMAAAGWRVGLGMLYYAGLVIAGGLALYQYRLIRGRERTQCFKACLNNNWLGLAIFAGLAADLYFRIR
ncbi:MAG TPA: 4-hydroxybenzoate octaprenyltransferase, partial [Burkholderiales bacterium]|nr:4-hydroxybenzoate octaprenyltransferase [Burkholderiales bacterium]